MAPSGNTRRTRRARAARKNHQKAEPNTSNSYKEDSVDLLSDNSSTTIAIPSDETHIIKTFGNNSGDADNISNYSGCSTPKGKKYRIPEIRTCPPAPKKRRAVSNCSLKRSPVAFFAPPDVELFFLLALRDISV